MRQLLLILLGVVGVARADVFVDTYLMAPIAEEDCTFVCAPFNFVLYDEPTVNYGALLSATWSFIDYQQSFGGVNDLYEPVGETYTWTTTEGDESEILGLDVSATQYNAGITCSCSEIGRGGGVYNTFEAQGQLDFGIFATVEATGYAIIPVTPFVSASSPVVDGDADVRAALDAVGDNAQLTVTYVFAPEPRGAVVMLAVGLVVFLLNARRVTKKLS